MKLLKPMFTFDSGKSMVKFCKPIDRYYSAVPVSKILWPIILREYPIALYPNVAVVPSYRLAKHI